MARPLRIEYAGAWYHVMNRGTGRKQVFKTDEQRQYFLSLLSQTSDRFLAEWHAYCLMGNHYHLLLRTPEGNLQRIMRHLNGVYTQYFNRSERRDGALFRGRYKAILVDADAYWLPLSRYIHRNPLEAGMVKRLESYRWSSYRAYIGKETAPPWLTTQYTLKAIGGRNLHARYKAYVAGDTEPALQEYYQAKRSSPILGNEAFKKQVLAGKAPNIDIPDLKEAIPRLDFDEIISATIHYYDVAEESIWQSTRGRGVKSPARSVAMYLCQYIGDKRLSEIAEYFELSSYASAGSTVRMIRNRIIDDRQLEKDINCILLDLTPSSCYLAGKQSITHFRPRIQTMKVKYFDDTDTLYIEFRDNGIAESRDLDENTVLDVDAQGNVCAITFEHASQRTDVRHLTVEGIAA